jgi:hypothetical protein
MKLGTHGNFYSLVIGDVLLAECELVVNLGCILDFFSALMLLLVIVAKTCCIQFSFTIVKTCGIMLLH